MANEETNGTKPKEKQKVHVALTQTEMPRIVEKKGKEWIDFGVQNDYPLTLIDLMNSSAIHNAVLVSKAGMVAGKALTYVKEGLTVEDQASVEKFIREPNEDETLEDIVRKISLDFEVFGAFCLQIEYSKGGNKIARIRHVDPSLIRSGKFNKDRKVTEYYYSENWMRWREPEYQPFSIAAFDPTSKDKIQLLYVKMYRPGQKYYGIPGFNSARSWIEIDSELGLYHLSQVKNGMTPSLWVSMNNGIPPPEEQDEIFEDIKKDYVGSRNAGKFILTFSDSKETAPTIDKISQDTGKDQLYVILNNQTIQNILAGHRIVSPMLFGIKTEGQLGGNSELEASYKIFDKNVITPTQVMIERTLNKLMRVNGLRGGVKIEKSDVVEFTFEDNILQSILTVNEMRRKINLPDLTDAQVAELRGGIQNAPTQNSPMN